MTVTLIFLALLMATLVGWLLKQSLGVQPWEAEAVSEGGPANAAGPFIGHLSLVVLLAVITSLFALFISAYYMRMAMPDWNPLIEPNWLWLNTVALMAGSVALHFAWRASLTSKSQAMRQWLVVGAILIGIFIMGQFIAWQQLRANGLYASSNPANAFFFTLTGLHALHLIGGLIALSKAFRSAWAETLSHSVCNYLKLCAWYFHYLFIVWLFLFIVMLIN